MLQVHIYKFEGNGNIVFIMFLKTFMSKMKLEAPKTLILTSRRDRYGAYWNLWVKADKTVCHLKKKSI